MGQRQPKPQPQAPPSSRNEPADTENEQSPEHGVLVIGEGGSGKSTLIANLLGKEMKQYKSAKKEPCYVSVVVNTGVPIEVYDMFEVRNGDTDQGCLREIANLLQSGKIAMVILCVKVERLQTSFIALCKEYNKIGVNWEKMVIALTFTDCLYMPNRDTNPPFIVSKCFTHAVAQWKLWLQKLLSEQVGVKQEVVRRIRIHPTTRCHDEALPNGEKWFAPLLSSVMKMLPLTTTSPTPEPLQNGIDSRSGLRESTEDVADPRQPSTSSAKPETRGCPHTVVLDLREGSESFGEPVCKAPLEVEPNGVGTVSEECAVFWQSVKQMCDKVPTFCSIFGILVIGETGSGKSNLINSLLGRDVARVGHTMQSETSELIIYDPVIEGVGLNVYDTPGMDHSTNDDRDFANLRMMQDMLAREKIHLVIYCFRMTETRMRRGLIHAVREYRKIGLPWQHTIMALTFADCVPNFDTRLPAVEEMLREEILTKAAVKPEVVKGVRICPTTEYLDQLLPNGEQWFPAFSGEVKAILSEYTKHVAA